MPDHPRACALASKPAWRSRKTIPSNLALFTLLVLASPASAASLQVSYSVRGSQYLEGTINLPGAVQGNLLSSANSFSSFSTTAGGSRGDFGSYAHRASFGELGTSLRLNAHCYGGGCGQEYMDTPMSNSSYFNDRLTLVNAPAAGFVEFQYVLEGSWASIANGAGWTDQGVWLVLGYGLGQSSTLATHSALANPWGAASSAGPYTASGSVLVPFNSPSVGFSTTLSAWARCDSGSNGDCTANLFFGNTGRLGGLRVYDSAMNLVPNATILSESGHDYTQSVDTNPVPEPAGLGAAGLAFVILARVRRRQRPHPDPAPLERTGASGHNR